MKYMYQLRVNGVPVAPIRDNWEDTFQDAVDLGVGKQLDAAEHVLEPVAKIVRIKEYEGTGVSKSDNEGSSSGGGLRPQNVEPVSSGGS